MTVMRLIVDVHTSEADLGMDYEEYSQELYKVVNGVFTESHLTGEENVTVIAHKHVSNNRVNCEACDELRYDGIY